VAAIFLSSVTVIFILTDYLNQDYFRMMNEYYLI